MRNNYIDNTNGIISFIPGEYRYANSPDGMAEAMTAGDVLALLTACNGNFSRLGEKTAQALSIKAGNMEEARQEAAKRKAEYRKRREIERHNEIMQEIRELMQDKDEFSTLDVQLAAANRGNEFPVRTRQMYSSHLQTGAIDGEINIKYGCRGKCINVILRNGKKSTQIIPGTRGNAYKFITK